LCALCGFILAAELTNKEPSIYDIYTEGEGLGSGGRMQAGGGGQLHVDVHTEN